MRRLVVIAAAVAVTMLACSGAPDEVEPSGGSLVSPVVGSVASEESLRSGGSFTDVTAGPFHVCGLGSDGSVVCWGANFHGEADAPAGEFRVVSAGSGHSCGVRVDGTITCWGANRHGEADAPAGRFRDVSAGSSHSCGLRVDDTITCWGESYSRVTEPRGRFDAVSAGQRFSCGLRVDGTITCWGDYNFGWAAPPEGRFRSVSAGFEHACGLGVDGVITCWGNVEFPRWEGGRFGAVTASWGWHGCGLRVDGTIACWGYGWYGQTDAPERQFRAVAAGESFSCGLRTEGTIICWGTNDHGPLNMPEAGIGAATVAAAEPADVPARPPPATAVAPVARFTHEFDWGTFTLAEGTAGQLAEDRTMTIAVGVDGTDLGLFSEAVRIGVDRACEAAQSRLRVTCKLFGPPQPDTGGHLGMLRDLLGAGRVDCLAIQAHSPGAYIDAINDFVDAGIPVFTFHLDIANSKRFAFFGMGDVAAGVANGRVTAELVRERGIDVNVVAVGSGAPNNDWAQQRIEGFIQGFAEAFPDTTFLNDQTNALRTGENFTPQEAVDAVGPFLIAHSDVNLFFQTDYGVEGVGQVIANQDKIGKVWASGFNVSDLIFDLIDQGAILVTIDAGIDNQAESAVTACADLLADGKLPASDRPQVPPIVVTRDGGDGRMTTTEARQRLAQLSQ